MATSNAKSSISTILQKNRGLGTPKQFSKFCCLERRIWLQEDMKNQQEINQSLHCFVNPDRALCKCMLWHTKKMKMRCWNTVRLLRLESLSDWRNCPFFFCLAAWPPDVTSFRPTCESVGRNYEGAFTKQLFRKTSLSSSCCWKLSYTCSTHCLTEGYLLATSRHVPAVQNDVTPRGQAAEQNLACKTGGTFFAFSGDHEAMWSARRARRAQVSRSPENVKKAPALRDKQHATRRLTMLYFHNFWRGVSLVITE